MRLMRLLSAVMVAGALGFATVGGGATEASASPAVQAPQKPPKHDDFCPPFCGDQGRGHRGGGDRYCPPWCDNHHIGNWDKGPWWASNPHPWWDDRQGPPPWGWGPPPAYQWHGGPPRPFKYWGFDVNPVWDPGFHQWGIWLFGLWIPIFGIG